MRMVFAIMLLLCCTGCLAVPRETSRCHVVDVVGSKPITGAHVWIQPFAPIHPFWPRGDSGLTNANGDVWLSEPTGFWFYITDIRAPGYRMTTNSPERNLPEPDDGSYAIFYMERRAR